MADMTLTFFNEIRIRQRILNSQPGQIRTRDLGIVILPFYSLKYVHTLTNE